MDGQAHPLTNYLSWRDQRTIENLESDESLIERIRHQWTSNGQLAELGQELQPGSTSCLLAWLNEHHGLPSNSMFGCLGDWVIARLVGHPIPMHGTQAIGLLDLSHDDWHRAALDAIGLAKISLPELSLSETCVGWAPIAGRTFRVFGSYGDQQCALRGTGLQRQELSLNISTGSQVSRRVAKFQPGDYQSRKYFYGDFLDTITHIPAGRSLNVLVDLLSELAQAEGITLRHPWETIQRRVEEVAETDLHVDLAFFRSPVGERGQIGRISTENLSIGTLFHAAYRSMADNYAQLTTRFVDTDWSAVVLSGGLTQSASRLRELIEQRFNAPIRESNGEESLLGLMDLARTV